QAPAPQSDQPLQTGDGAVRLNIQAPPGKGAKAGLKVQFQDSAKSTRINARVWGVGISTVSDYEDWKSSTNGNFGSPNATTGIRQATANMTGILAGKRRIFRVLFEDGSGFPTTVDYLLGVGDVT